MYIFMERAVNPIRKPVGHDQALMGEDLPCTVTSAAIDAQRPTPPASSHRSTQ